MNGTEAHVSASLEFSGPFKLCGTKRHLLFDSDQARLSGIYLWAVRFKDGFLIEYAGETGRSFFQRMKEHMIQCLGGNYRVYEAEALLKGEKRVLWNGMWRKGTHALMPEFVEKYVALAPKIRDYLSALEVFVAPTQVDKRTRRRIEGAVAQALRTKPAPVGTFFADDVRFVGRKVNETPIEVRIHLNRNLLGLDSHLWA
jgi:hypothetical protein